MSIFTIALPSLAVPQSLGYPAGVDFSTFTRADGQPGMDPNWVPMRSGVLIVLEHVVRRWIIVPGEMHNRTIGAGVLAYVNKPMTSLQIGALQAKLKEQAIQVEGVDDAQVLVTRTDRFKLNIQGNIVLATGQTWTFVFVLTEANITLLNLTVG